MPMVKIEILEGKPSSYKEAVLNSVKNAIIDAVIVDEINFVFFGENFKVGDIFCR